MCGIVGIRHFGRPEPVDPGLLSRMNDLLSHRGPDDAGVWTEGGTGLAMRRLSVIDLETGSQPMCNEDGRLRIVFNGEIYNYRELGGELAAKGHPFKTRSDTEVILHLYEELGDDCVKRLRGMFAFALWDGGRRRLLLARDRLGKKPLVYALGHGRLAWASEIRPLLELPDLSREISPEALDLYLGLQYIPSPHTIYREIRKLSPAHRLVLEGGQARVERYWDLPVDAPPLDFSPDEAAAALREKFMESVRLRMVSDVPLGAFLSGGVDSACVVGAMSRLSDRPVRTFSVGFEEAGFSELKEARETAGCFGTDHTEIVVKPEMADVLPRLALRYGEPFGDNSALPAYYISRETRRHVTVALNGDGGDESFAGYRRYAAMKAMSAWDSLPGPVRGIFSAAARGAGAAGVGGRTLRWARRFLESAAEPSAPARYLSLLGYFSPSDKEALYAPEFRSLLGAEAQDGALQRLEALFDRGRSLDPVNRMLFADLSGYLPECLMAKADISSMANSLEARSPFLDHELVELAFRMPGDWKLKGFCRGKWILKRALSDFLPAGVRQRPKRGFGLPLGPWFRGPLAGLWRDHVFAEGALSRRYFQAEVLRRLFEEHQSGRADHGYKLWVFLMLEVWHRSLS